ncbi:hypothetical protein ACFSTE_22285 [Aquimarina hainanensis]|uniref:Uncharacterized protein n=1 Tax=Aquimarina hainanensis TaxID=1578017 RepID=A0ABW5NGA1_9FLAO|nr:hypothetical protein [Aquimarina sp. TRL1]QKX07431.1 hypothetical protein HN014_21770 [Aquimarina sp. TRL1]
MRTFCITVLLLSCLNVESQDQKGIISDISTKYEVIRELIGSNSFSKENSSYFCKDFTESGIITYYYNSSELKHILHTYTQNHISHKDEYYVWNNQLFFQLTTHTTHYKTYKESPDPIDITHTMEKRYYFDKEKSILCKVKEYQTKNNQPIKTNSVSSKKIRCNQSQDILKKYKILLDYKSKKSTDNCMVAREMH